MYLAREIYSKEIYGLSKPLLNISELTGIIWYLLIISEVALSFQYYITISTGSIYILLQEAFHSDPLTELCTILF